jgi:hypothetical protein
MPDQDPPSTPPPGPTPGSTPTSTTARRAGVDVRAREIRTGAGLEESKYNTELIEFLQKYSVYIMLAIVLVVGGYFFYNRYQEKKTDALGAAFEALDKALAPQQQNLDVSPEVLLAIASDHAGQASVPLLARLAAADQWLLSSARGLLPGAEVDSATGVAKNAEDALTSDKAAELLAKAKEQYGSVKESAAGKSGLVLFELRALFGLAAVAESAGPTDATQWEVAKGHYQAAQALAKASGHHPIADLAQKRLADVDTLKDVGGVIPEDQIVTFKKPEPIALPAGTPGLSVPSLSGPSALPGLNVPGLSMPAAPAPQPTQPAPPAPAPPPPAPAP